VQYRREIDGLRALAVVPVILFHAGFASFSGGFVGVDVFFVISGYLITSLIIGEQAAGKFTILKFYERRARRILPALFLVLLVCLPAAWLWLLPYDMKMFSQSLIAVCAFASNILFWRTSGYFDTASELKPLLHTWSLAVEEQYYVFFPVLIILTWRFGKRWMVTLFAVIGVLSLLGAEWYTSSVPSLTFFSLQTRAWELLLGACAAFYLTTPDRKPVGRWVGELGGALGLLLILYSVFAYDKQTPFPGFHALVPTVGAVLIILFATPQTLIGKVFGSKVMVGIGLISYSAYLWHQPLFAFARQRSFEVPGPLTYLVLTVISLGLAYLTWKYIETPFRDRTKFTRKQIFAYAACGSLFLLSVGLAGQLTKGTVGRYTGAQGDFLHYFENSFPDWQYAKRVNLFAEMRGDCDFFDLKATWSGHTTNLPAQISKSCYERNPAQPHAILIWGDSHAQQFYYGLKNTLPPDWQILQIASSGCTASLVYVRNPQNYCEYSNYFALQTIQQARPDVVLVGQEHGHSVEAMETIAAKLKAAGVGKVLFTGPSPHWKRGGLPALTACKLWGHIPRYSTLGLDEDFNAADARLKEDFPPSTSARYVSLMDYFCGKDGCLVYFGNDVKAGITSFDYSHLTSVSSLHFAKDVLAREIVSGAPAEALAGAQPPGQ